jgi:hypothetical protein
VRLANEFVCLYQGQLEVCLAIQNSVRGERANHPQTRLLTSSAFNRDFLPISGVERILTLEQRGLGVGKGKGFAPPCAALTYAFARQYHLDTEIKLDFHRQGVENSSVMFSVQLWRLELESERGNFENEHKLTKERIVTFFLHLHS